MSSVIGLNATSVLGTTLGVDGIKEYKVVTSMYTAEYGLVIGGQTTMVSKGGSNQLHGDVFEYLRNSALDARNNITRRAWCIRVALSCISIGLGELLGMDKRDPAPTLKEKYS